MPNRHVVTRVIAVGLLLWLVIHPVGARFIVGGLRFQEMFDKADLVVIATVLRSKDTSERKKLFEIQKLPTDHLEQFQDDVIGVETEFKIRVRLKTPKDFPVPDTVAGTRFFLHHYRMAGTREPDPNFIDPKTGHNFLMFLVREKDGRFAPVTGQYDPAVLSVLELRSATPDFE